MRWSWLNNRFVITFGTIAVLVAVWNVYIAYHDHGLIEGRVVGPNGAPVAGATVHPVGADAARRPAARQDDDRRGRPLRIHRPPAAPALPGGGEGWRRPFRPAASTGSISSGEDLILSKPLQASEQDSSLNAPAPRPVVLFDPYPAPTRDAFRRSGLAAAGETGRRRFARDGERPMPDRPRRAPHRRGRACHRSDGACRGAAGARREAARRSSMSKAISCRTWTMRPASRAAYTVLEHRAGLRAGR